MSFESDLRTKVLSGTVATLVSTRMYPLVLAQDCTFPALVYSRVSTSREHSMSGPSGLAHPRIQIECYAETHAGARSLADAVRALLDGFAGTIGSTVIQGIILLDDRDMFGEQTPVYRTDLDFEIWYTE